MHPGDASANLQRRPAIHGVRAFEADCWGQPEPSVSERLTFSRQAEADRAQLPKKKKKQSNLQTEPEPEPETRRQAGYKPYSLKEFKENYADPTKYRLGGLGADIGSEEWQRRHSKAQAMKEFASKLKTENRAKSLGPPKQRKIEKEVSKRDRALQFAKNVPKPTQIRKKVSKGHSAQDAGSNGLEGLDEQPGEPVYDEFEELNKKHEEYLNEVDNIKRLFM